MGSASPPGFQPEFAYSEHKAAQPSESKPATVEWLRIAAIKASMPSAATKALRPRSDPAAM